MMDLMELLMIVCFGLSWPISIYRSYVSRTAKGKSLFFEVFLCIGYVLGIVRKFLQQFSGTGTGTLFYVGWFFYFLNLVEITADMILYFRNAALDKQREMQLEAEVAEESAEEDDIR